MVGLKLDLELNLVQMMQIDFSFDIFFPYFFFLEWPEKSNQMILVLIESLFICLHRTF